MKKFNEFLNESIRDQMKSKSEDEMLKNLNDKEVISYNKLKELKEYIENNSNFKPTIYLGQDYVGRKVSLRIKLDYAWSNISFDGDFTVNVEDFINNSMWSETTNTVKETFELLYKVLKETLKDGLRTIKIRINDAQKELSESTKTKEDIEKILENYEKI